MKTVSRKNTAQPVKRISQPPKSFLIYINLDTVAWLPNVKAAEISNMSDTGMKILISQRCVGENGVIALDVRRLSTIAMVLTVVRVVEKNIMSFSRSIMSTGMERLIVDKTKSLAVHRFIDG